MPKTIRQQAEELLQSRLPNLEAISPEDLKSALHELHVHQVELELQNEELRQAQEQLQATQKRYFELYNYAPVGYLTVDEKGRILDINLTGAEMLSRERQNLTGKLLTPFLVSDSVVTFFNHIGHTLKTDQPQTTELVLQVLDARNIVVHVKSRAAQENGRQVCRMTLTDITEQKKAEHALSRSEGRFRQFAESIDQVLWITSLNPEKTFFISRAFTEIWGRPVETLYRNPNVWIDGVHPDDRQRVTLAFTNWVERKNTTYREEYRVVQPDGTIRWVLDVGAAVIYENNRPVQVSGIAKDITADKLIAEKIQQNEELLRLALEGARMGTWSRDIRTDKLTWSDQHGPILGLPAGANIEDRADFLEMIHPEDRHLLDEATENALQGNLYHCEYRVVWPDGSLHWLEARGRLNRDGQGQPLRLTGTVMDISEQKEAEEQLKQLLAYYQTLFNDTPTSLWEEDFSAVKTALNQLQASGVTDFKTYFAQNPAEVYRLWGAIRVIAVNEATRKLYRIADSEKFSVRLAPLEGRPKTFALFCRQLAAIAAGETRFFGEATSKTAEGVELDIMVSWSVVPGYETSYGRVLVAIVDVTELKQTEAALRAERASLAQRVADRTAELRLMQHQTEALYQVTRSILHNQNWRDLVQTTLNTVAQVLPADRVVLYLLDMERRQVLESAVSTTSGEVPSVSNFDELWAGLTGWVIRNGKPTLSPGDRPDPRESEKVRQIRAERKAGSVMVTALHYQDKVLGTLTALRQSGDAEFTVGDLELLQVMADQIAVALTRVRLTESLRQRTEELLWANQLKDQFLTTISHELRTPLNVMLANTEIMQEEIFGPLTEKQAQALNRISDSGQHLLQLIDDILDLSEMQIDRLKLNIEPVSVAKICRDSLNSIQAMAREKSIQVTPPPDFPVSTIEGDEQRLEQILVKLLTNAVKFTPGGGQVGLQVESAPKNDEVNFVVWDTGIGINQADIAIIFDSFVQLDGSLSRKAEGTGLGLTLVQRLVRLHGGTISVESEPGQGTRFIVSLPQHASVQVDAQAGDTD